jgi:hypothetical protein
MGSTEQHVRDPRSIRRNVAFSKALRRPREHAYRAVRDPLQRLGSMATKAMNRPLMARAHHRSTALRYTVATQRYTGAK